MKNILMPTNFESVDIFEEFYKSFIHKFLRFLQVIGIAVANIHGKFGQEVIQFLLAATVILNTTFQYQSYFPVVWQKRVVFGLLKVITLACCFFRTLEYVTGFGEVASI